MDYDKQIKEWAAFKLGIAPGNIEEVEFELHDGHWYSEYTYEEGYAEAAVTTATRKTYRIQLDRHDFGATIREIMDA